ncbi:potassium voltage-gated channel protein Shaw-like [Watersipora subatra]|uniref:potassium voltage-gated channel protein Shaw-like n=1 Tax=Watersipora subatra TaxID=2589382 RepID=UPI00355B4E50
MPTERIVIKPNRLSIDQAKIIDLDSDRDSGLFCDSPHSKLTLDDTISTFTDVQELETVHINVGGTKFEVPVSTLRRIPGTRLSRLAENLCDDKNYREDTKDYYFDRNVAAFADILEYYRCGELHLDQANCGAIFKKVGGNRELEYWGLNFTDISMCCWNKYDSNRADIAIYNELDKIFEGPSRVTAPADETSRLSWLKFYIYHTLENPKFSVLAKVFVLFSFIVTAGSVFTFIAETHYVFQQLTLENGTRVPAPPVIRNTSQCCCYFNLSEHLTNHSADQALNVTHNETEEEHGLHDESHIDSHEILHQLDYFTFSYFVFELLLRFLVSYNKKTFFREVLNAVEVVCLTAHITSMIEHGLTEDTNLHIQKAQELILFLKSLRIMRIVRIFRLFRHMTGFKVLAYTIVVSVSELLLILSFLFTAVLIFASIIHYVEEETFTSIPYAIWWAVVTMTTVGYGDVVPQTPIGYFIGALCVVSGTLVIAFTVPVVVNNFTQYYILSMSRKSKVNQTGELDIAQENFQKWVKPSRKSKTKEQKPGEVIDIRITSSPR